jgi:predicted amidohydrolase YtcJ
MRTSVVAAAFTLASLLSALGQQPAAPPPAPTPTASRPTSPAIPTGPTVTALKAARVFDGRSDRMIENGVVIVEGSRIREVGAKLAIPPQATALDLGDATILAGFIDSHTHLTDEAGENWLADFYEGLRRPVSEKAIIATAMRSTADSSRDRGCWWRGRRSARPAATATGTASLPGRSDPSPVPRRG